jgi:hypothetical protein
VAVFFAPPPGIPPDLSSRFVVSSKSKFPQILASAGVDLDRSLPLSQSLALDYAPNLTQSIRLFSTTKSLLSLHPFLLSFHLVLEEGPRDWPFTYSSKHFLTLETWAIPYQSLPLTLSSEILSWTISLFFFFTSFSCRCWHV